MTQSHRPPYISDSPTALFSAAAECVCVTSIAGHFCIDDFKAVSPLLVVDMIAEVTRAIEVRGLKRIGIMELAP